MRLNRPVPLPQILFSRPSGFVQRSGPVGTKGPPVLVLHPLHAVKVHIKYSCEPTNVRRRTLALQSRTEPQSSLSSLECWHYLRTRGTRHRRSEHQLHSLPPGVEVSNHRLQRFHVLRDVLILDHLPRCSRLSRQPPPPWLDALGRQLVEPLRQRGKRGDRLLGLHPLGSQVGGALGVLVHLPHART
jgi:hypothetical protein